MTNLETALDLADQFIPVFPCRPDNKAPLTPHGHNDASIEPAQITAWWTAHPDATIGVPAGPASGFDVLDLDERHGARAWLLEHRARLPQTRIHRTRSGGAHLLFKAQPGMRCSVGNPAPGCDVRASGGYIVWWPAHDHAPVSTAEIAAWPAWLLADILAHTPAASESTKAPAELAAPSAQAVVDLLDRLPNPLHLDRDRWIAILLAARGCIQGLEAANACTPAEADSIREAACAWSDRWEGGATDDVRAKWDDDLATRVAPLAGWRNLERHAAELIPGYSAEMAATEFAAAPLPAEPEDPDAWREMLFVTATTTRKDGSTSGGGPESSLANACIAFRHAPAWRDALAYDDFAYRIVLKTPAPWGALPGPLTDADFTRAAEWLRREGMKISSSIAGEAMAAVAKERPFHPVREYLDGLTWDATPRADTWLTDHLGAADTPLNRAFASKFLISAVARVFSPGCQVDTILLLEGEQGLRKSTCLMALFSSPWFTGQVPDLRNKDALAQLQGKWCQEHAELTSLTRSDANTVKAYMSTQVDRFRPSYGRVAEDFPRQCVFAGTLNPAGVGYLKDETGARRFWPVACGVDWPPGRRADAVALSAVRGQLWAEALVRYRAGEAWYLDTAEMERAQASAADDRYDSDSWEAAIAGAIAGKPYVRIEDVMREALGMPAKEHTRAQQMRVATSMHKLGWTQSRVTLDGQKHRVYFPPGGRGAEVISFKRDGLEALL